MNLMNTAKNTLLGQENEWGSASYTRTPHSAHFGSDPTFSPSIVKRVRGSPGNPYHARIISSARSTAGAPVKLICKSTGPGSPNTFTFKFPLPVLYVT